MARQPNFLIVLTDDQGYGDAGCYGGGDLQTPHFDRLAASGCRFTQWYGGAPVCSASRASLMSGRFPWQVGVPGNVPADQDATGLDTTVPTLPEHLKRAGYQTFMSGKWHLGQRDGERPHQRGFDHWFGFLHGCIDYYSHIFYWLMGGANLPPRHDLYLDGEEIYRNGEYFTDLVADHAIAYLKQAAATDEPFFLYVPFNNPHYPMHAPADVVERFADLPEDRKWFAAMMYTYDRALGRILDALEELSLTDDTIVFASSDHGPSREPRNWPDGRTDAVYQGGSTGGLRGHKFSCFEGGIRLPALLRWPGVTEPGQTCDAIGHHADLLPTFTRAAGFDVNDPALAGGDLRPVLTGQQTNVDRPGPLCWSFANQRALRAGPWKLIENAAAVDSNDEPGLRLYHLNDDPAETRDQTPAQTDRVAELSRQLDRATR